MPINSGLFGSTRLAAFDAFLRDNAIPINSVSQSGNAPGGVSISFQSIATQLQIDFGNNAKASFDWRKQVPLDRNTVASALSSLDKAQLDAIQRHQAADYLIANPDTADSIGRVLGTALPVMKVDPTETVPT